jgi:hypothetical protein
VTVTVVVLSTYFADKVPDGRTAATVLAASCEAQVEGARWEFVFAGYAVLVRGECGWEEVGEGEGAFGRPEYMKDLGVIMVLAYWPWARTGKALQASSNPAAVTCGGQAGGVGMIDGG